MTRDELIEAMAVAIAAHFGEHDSPEDAARSALAAIDAAGFAVVPKNPKIGMYWHACELSDEPLIPLDHASVSFWNAMLAASPLYRQEGGE